MTSSATQWRKATASNNGGDCVELRFTEDGVLVRDSKYIRDPANDPAAAPTITIPVSLWPAFLNRVAADANGGDKDQRLPLIVHSADGTTRLHAADGVVLAYTAREWDAFIDGVLRGEFEPTPTPSPLPV
ncbi:DUF397 domain-containing protein [Nocardia sp. CNY236]|uniref:DUF397 domain-containing protein n=1 Tax=Nocardia sp. CNY236 TaxID=1169152 RepID=UPI000565724D|nr:DUF397 domain-containing protein [Nocardia sp. CNY236]